MDNIVAEMRARLPHLPTLGEFLAAAESQGCSVCVFRERFIVHDPTGKVMVVINLKNKGEQLTQFLTESYCRTLGVSGFTTDDRDKSSPGWRPTPDEET
jgi:hypothetical protein